MPSIWVTLPKCQAGPLAHRTPLRREQGPLKPPSFPTGSSHSSFQLMRNAMEAHAHTFIRDRRRAHCLSQSLIVHQGNGFQKRSHCYWKGNPGTVLMGLQAASVSGHQVQARAWQMPPHMSFSGTSRGPAHPCVKAGRSFSVAMPTTRMRERGSQGQHTFRGRWWSHRPPGQGKALAQTRSHPQSLVPAAASGAPRPPSGSVLG